MRFRRDVELQVPHRPSLSNSSEAMRLLALCLTLLLSRPLAVISTHSLDITDLSMDQGLSDCNQTVQLDDLGQCDTKVEHGGDTLHVYVSGLSVTPTLCNRGLSVRPCFRVQLDIMTEGIYGDSAGSGDIGYADQKNKDEHERNLENLNSASLRVQVCYKGTDFSGSVDLQCRVHGTEGQTTRYFSVMLTESDFGSVVYVYTLTSNSNLSTSVTMLPRDTVCLQDPEIKWCKATLQSDIDHNSGVAQLHLQSLAQKLPKVCQSLEKDGECLKLEWKTNPLMIPLSSVAPCLCFQIWWGENPRKQFCPFVNKTVLSVSNVSVSVVEAPFNGTVSDRSTTVLSWVIKAPCKVDTLFQLCKSTGYGADCPEIKESGTSGHLTQRRDEWLYEGGVWRLNGEFLKVPRHSSLCVQVKVAGINGRFDPVCLFKVERSRWSIFVLVCVVLLCLTVVGVYILQRHIRGSVLRWLKVDNITKMVGGSQVVLLYPPDEDSALEELVCHLGSELSSLGFGVTSELWSRAELHELGPVPWLHSRLHGMQCYGGKVVLVLTRTTWARAEEWCRSRAEKDERREKCSDVFSASLSCILADYLQGRAGERFVLVRFETQPAGPLSDRGCMPELFRGLPLFSLPSQSLGFLTELTQRGGRGNERFIKRTTRAAMLRAGARKLAGTLRELMGGAGHKVGVSQECTDPWVTVPLKLEDSGSSPSPELYGMNTLKY